MLRFDSFAGMVVCTRHSRGLRRWLDIFARAFGSYSLKYGRGGWLSEHNRVRSEPNLAFEVWGLDLQGVRKLVRLARRFQAAEDQESVGIFWLTPQTGWQARVVWAADWPELEAEITAAFSQVRVTQGGG